MNTQISRMTFQFFHHQTTGLIEDRFEELWTEATQEARLELFSRIITSLIHERLLPTEEVNVWGLTRKMASKLHSMPIRLFRFTLGPKEELCVPLSRFSMFARVTPFPYVLHKRNNGLVREINDPLVLFHLVAPAVSRFALPDERINFIGAALENSLENLTVAICYRIMRREFPSHKGPTGSIFYEQLVTCGHTINPLTKYRRAKGDENLLPYLPELQTSIRVGFVAVKKDHVQTQLRATYRPAEWLPEEIEIRLRQALPANLSFSDYRFFPVHPWQYTNTLPTLFAREIQEGTVIPLGNDFMEGQPSLSLRTVHFHGKHAPFYLKLPINIQNASHVRTVSPHAATNGPLVSHIISQIELCMEPSSVSLRFLYENEGAFFSPVPPQEMTPEMIRAANHLAYIERDSPDSVTAEGELAIVTIALLDNNRITPEPFLHTLLERYADSKGIDRGKEAALAWFKQFIGISIVPLITYLIRYGI
ncbi:hypothetical protein KJ865_08035, partial [Myxococcota bacterium]|nr:hypothetical protein [Myxococcota bacterium]